MRAPAYGEDTEHVASDSPLDLGELTAALDARLADADARLARDYPGANAARQPVHTVYVPADRVHAGLAADWGRRAGEALTEFAPKPEDLLETMGMSEADLSDLLSRVHDKLAREPIEDLRADLEDGYGDHGDEGEDTDVVAVAEAFAADLAKGTATPYFGIRMKGMEAAGRHRGVRSLTLFLQTLLERHGSLPDNLLLTLPKITSVEHVEAMAWVAERLERRFDLPEGRLRFELQIETPQSVLLPDGTAAVPHMIRAGQGRVSALHYGTYDYSAACGITAAHQSLAHPVADHAKAVMQVAAAGTGVCCPTAAATSCRWAAARRSTTRGTCTPGWSAARWSAASTRAGTSTPTSCPCASWPPTPSTGRPSSPPPPGSRPTSERSPAE